jgi:PAP2 superfamily
MKKAFIFFLFVVLIISSCKEEKNKVSVNAENLQNECVHRLTDVIVYDIFTPPVASRIYAYSNLAYYEAIRFKGSSAGISIAAQMHGFEVLPNIEKNKEYDYTLAAVKSFFKVAKALTFSKDSLATTEKKILEQFKYSISEAIYNNSLELGDSIASSILKRAAADNYKITRGMPKYSVFKETGKWQQTPPEYADAVEPNWRLIKPMLLDSAAQFKPIAPPVYDLNKKSNYYKELIEVYTISKQITPLQDTIAHYWDDNPFVTQHNGHLTFATKKTTPAGHWMGIIAILCGQQKAGEIKTAAIYALVSCAIFDGFISCWDEKYRSKMVRPVTVIRENLQPEWTSLLQTPPFPEYTSGHSVITSAAAAVLTHQMGDSIFFTDTTELEYLGLQRSFNSIQQAADEAGISRLYGGIHYRSAIEQGKKQGQQIGNLYNNIFK